jgi:hypothetical protein
MIQIAFMTGQSDRRSCSLSPAQRSFLTHLCTDQVRACRLNFPYRHGMAPYRPRTLLMASVNNGLQVMMSRSPAYAERHRPAVVRMLESAPHTVLLAGSCGLELFNRLDLPTALLDRTSIFAFGPVARARPACRFFCVQGRRDWLSRASFGQVDRVVDGGHLHYLQNPDVVSHARAFVQREIAETIASNEGAVSCSSI